MALRSVKAFIQDQDIFVMSLMALLPATEAKAMVCNIVTLFTRLVDKIALIITWDVIATMMSIIRTF